MGCRGGVVSRGKLGGEFDGRERPGSAKLRRLFPASSGVLATDAARMDEANRPKGPAERFLKALSEIFGASLHRD